MITALAIMFALSVGRGYGAAMWAKATGDAELEREAWGHFVAAATCLIAAVWGLILSAVFGLP